MPKLILERFAIVTMKVPLRLDYPYKAGQPDLRTTLQEGVCDGIRWRECVDGIPSVTVSIVEREQKR